MTIEDLIERTNYGLAEEGLTLSPKGEQGINDRWKKKESEGGFSQVMKDSEYINTHDKTPLEIWGEAQAKRTESLN